MHAAPLPLTKDVVLIGGGHTHALVLRKWGMRPLAGARLTVINPGPTAPYSGMLPGFVAGHYDRGALDIDLVKLARFAGARLILGAAEHIDTHARQVHVAGRPPIAYDVAAINLGITSAMPDMAGFKDHAIPAKPLGRFAASWATYLDGDGPAHVAVIGGGVAGVELILAMAHALRARRRLAQATLIDRGTILDDAGSKAQARLRNALHDLGVTVIEQATITQIEAAHVVLDDGRAIRSDFTTGAAGARPYAWLSNSGLDLHHGFVRVDSALQTSQTGVFASGDCAHFSTDPRPKAGVYAVRQAPVLYHNLRASLTKDPLRQYQPQKDYLKLISMGDKSAVGERFGQTFSGSWIWRWKDHIDQTFMAQFRDLPQMETPDLPPEHTHDLPEVLGEKPMCGGCGAKVGARALKATLSSAPEVRRADITPLPGDDAALLMTGGQQQVLSTDHLRAFTADPVVMARIAAVHALGDIWAMGAAPQAATANLILPKLSPELQARTLHEIMVAAGEIIRDAGADIVGGHTSVGDELTIGFSVTGLCHRQPITLAGAQPGDALILTKPLGTGVIMAAEMTGAADGAVVAGALTSMSQPQGQAAELLCGAHAMTDVTGFGLLGHLLGISEASKLGAELRLDAMPYLPGAAALSARGIRSSLFAENAAQLPEISTGGVQDLLFDPQTAGGLLAALPMRQAEALLPQLRTHSPNATIIGHMSDKAGAITLV
ncbi:putative selenide, water dikinase [Phaeobacter piscinae]|uniref:Selenide, water dikinase n=1 Tax=Phaeobacter piscinae TaxID=1580596 RepID=A0ABN5DD77_9RHOB|nr:selenide, water dikinase SelD [Phaeobacter piscinae]ATG35291.1 putative selenide, water dikinase [Phaeobacter piscinae]AUQ85811.1 putative selenide, water dikinase [Phaeobacter piscinae]AUR23695.1 putative selenide, water dikinase [Phaeobacter piscinae]